MLEPELTQQLTQYLTYLVNPIDIAVIGEASPKQLELQQLAQDIAALSPKINLTFAPAAAGVARTPCLTVAPQGAAQARVQFAGIPLGHEFTSLVLALLQSGGHPSKTAPDLIEHIKALEGNYHFETFISLSCQNCPDVVQALNLMAILNPNITHTMVDGALFQAEMETRQIMAVPSVQLNGQPFGQGRMSLEEILGKLDTGLSAKQAAAMADKAPFDVLVIGGGPAGAAAAIYAARKGIATGLVAKRLGGQVMDTVGIENFISIPYTEGHKLSQDLLHHVNEYGVDVMGEQDVTVLTKTAQGIELQLANGASLTAKAVILATGAKWRDLNVPGEIAYRTKGVAYCPHCDGPLFKGKKVAVIGGGNSGIEAAIDLAGIVEHVTVLEFAPTLRADAVLQRKAKSMANITIITNAQTTEVFGDGNKVTAIGYTDRQTQAAHTIELAGIFVQIGLVPNTAWLKDSGINLTKFGEIEVDSKGHTSIEGVFAAGDATTQPYKQIIISMGSGATAALSAFDYLIRKGS